jgi:exodeoxyribonuclease-3
MKIVSWNVNSIKARKERVVRFLKARKPDILCLQELKVTEENFPFSILSDLGYSSAVSCQKTYNGVAILSLEPPQNVQTGFNDGGDESQARVVSATIKGVRIVCVYVPNGQDMNSDKYVYKRSWMNRLKAYVDRSYSPLQPLVVAGDFNIAPADIDMEKPKRWRGTVLHNPEINGQLDELMSWGLVDTSRELQPEKPLYSWWDYRRMSFDRDDGLRIDLILATSTISERTIATFVDRDERKETENSKPSDHAPVVISVKWPPETLL